MGETIQCGDCKREGITARFSRQGIINHKRIAHKNSSGEAISRGLKEYNRLRANPPIRVANKGSVDGMSPREWKQAYKEIKYIAVELAKDLKQACFQSGIREPDSLIRARDISLIE